MAYDEIISDVVRVVEAVGAAVMVVGGAVALLAAIPAALDPVRRPGGYQSLRRNLGRVILLGLEILIIGDIVRTIVVEPTISSVLVLAMIVVIRIVLSFALEVEIDGRWPWTQQRARREADSAPPPRVTRRAAARPRAASCARITVMPIEDIDHVALPTARPEEMLAFYLGLGFSGPSLDEWRRRPRVFFSLALGNTKLNVHAPELWSDPAMTLRAPAAVPGCADLCFRWSGTVEEAGALLASVGAVIEEGPVERRGGRDHGRANGTSVYTRDPDGNLIELIAYTDVAAD